MLSLVMLESFLVFQVTSVQVGMHDLLHRSFVLLQVDLRLNQLAVSDHVQKSSSQAIHLKIYRLAFCLHAPPSRHFVAFLV